MDPKPDKECEKRGDIILLSKIIANLIDWQLHVTKGHLIDFCKTTLVYFF